jgi:pantoate kinase
MSKGVKISLPLHITGFFSPHFSKDPLFSGSTGAGFVIVPGLNCLCQFSKKNKVLYNGIETKIKPVEEILSFFRQDKIGFLIKISSPVDLGLGYAVSGASTLAVSLAIHRLLGKSDLKAAQLAHITEVKSLTGLGDVITIFSGRDLEIRIKPGGPGIGKVKSFSQAKNFRIITCDINPVRNPKNKHFYNKINLSKKQSQISNGVKRKSTKEMLKTMSSETIQLGQELLKKFIKEPNLNNFFRYSQLFAKEIGWADEAFFKKLEPIKKYCPGFSVKKGILFAVTEDKHLPGAISMLKKFFPKIHIFKFGGIKKDEK